MSTWGMFSVPDMFTSPRTCLSVPLNLLHRACSNLHCNIEQENTVSRQHSPLLMRTQHATGFLHTVPIPCQSFLFTRSCVYSVQWHQWGTIQASKSNGPLNHASVVCLRRHSLFLLLLLYVIFFIHVHTPKLLLITSTLTVYWLQGAVMPYKLTTATLVSLNTREQLLQTFSHNKTLLIANCLHRVTLYSSQVTYPFQDIHPCLPYELPLCLSVPPSNLFPSG